MEGSQRVFLQYGECNSSCKYA